MGVPEDQAHPPVKTMYRRLLTLALCLCTLHWFWAPEFNQSEPFPSLLRGEPGLVIWKSCQASDGHPLECGYITVPKDYNNATVGTATIAVAKLKTAHGKKKGTVFVNPGGPGGSGANFLLRSGNTLHHVVGSDWDVVGFDPRGIGRSVPETKCFKDDITEEIFFSNTILRQGYTVPNIANLSDPFNQYSLTVQQRQFLAIKEAQVKVCRENMDPEDLQYMGTTTVARDIDFMSRLLDGDDSKINFLGYSYGTIVGAYLVNMFPERIGRSVIDGVVDPVVWSSQPSHQWHKYWTSSAEAAYQWFLNDCSKVGSTSCPLARHKGESPAHIESRLEDFFQSLVTQPLAATAHGRPGYLTSGAARGVFFAALTHPAWFSLAATAFAEAMSPARNGTRLLSLMQATSGPGDLARAAVVCADSPSDFSPPTAEELADELLWAHQHTSKHWGSAMDYLEHDGGCEFWPTRGRGPKRFTGPWNATLEYPLLIISNTADPDTPISSGHLVNSNMPNSSTLLIQNGPGHCSLAVNSLCTIKATLAYFAGELPKNGTVCELTGETFPGSNSAVHSLSVQDRVRLDATVRLGHELALIHRPGLAQLM